MVWRLGNPQVRAPQSEPLGHDANQRARCPVQREVLAEDLRIARETLLPHLVAQYKNRRRARLGVARLGDAAQQRANSPKLERVSGDGGSAECLDPALIRPQNLLGGNADHAIENGVLFLIVQEFRLPERVPPVWLA